MPFEHDDRKAYDFIRFLDMMIRNPMNSYCFLVVQKNFLQPYVMKSLQVEVVLVLVVLVVGAGVVGAVVVVVIEVVVYAAAVAGW